ncbi:uncharacterized protein EV422DRAFT_563290 [Fimicolochytrium jonesii]|uniref:uncharacterized protein n=1 Tax=Fimicolochytrium jonesii TaxID=1396493 RepID=UPI0022FEF630|nr:uncharacterized protein EV422DRAFT_563290 [Fimicolochytrium jonesii]KAI8827204.1 hypothetical protein EV422DRAFT_563290 [Fimicolochytrium jonesii]
MAPIASGSHHSAPPKNSHKLPSLAAALAGHDQSFASPPPTPPPAQTLPSIQSLHATISGMNPYDPQFNSMGRIDYAHQDGRETMSLDRPRMHSGESSSAHEQQSHMSARDYQYGSNHGPASQPREIPRGGSSYYQPRHPYSVSHDATTSPSHLKEGRYQSYPEHTRRASPSDMEATYAEPERDVKMDTDMAPIPERSAAPSKGRRGNRTSSGSAPLEASAPPPPSKKSHPRKRSIMMVEDESVAGKQASVSINAAGVKTYECPTCHKTYKHANCLHKHKWEHTEYWAFASQFSMSKHQQVQLLEAASILVALGQGNAPASDGQPSKSGNVGGGDMLREGAEVEEFDRGGVEASSSGGRRVKREKLARDSKGSQGPIEVEG